MRLFLKQLFCFQAENVLQYSPSAWHSRGGVAFSYSKINSLEEKKTATLAAKQKSRRGEFCFLCLEREFCFPNSINSQAQLCSANHSNSLRGFVQKVPLVPQQCVSSEQSPHPSIYIIYPERFWKFTKTSPIS